MESQRDEAVPRHPKQSKPQNPAHVPSISRKDSIFSMPNLPAELITEILLKLPVKPLLRFSCVSKSWLAIISSAEFVKTYLLLSASNKYYTHHGVILRYLMITATLRTVLLALYFTILLLRHLTWIILVKIPIIFLGLWVLLMV